MTLVLYLTGLVLIGVVAVLVAAPLLGSATNSALSSESESQTAPWEKQKTDAYAAIKEAEFDHQMGKLTDEDYQVLRRKYEARAVEALAHLDRFGQPQKERKDS